MNRRSVLLAAALLPGVLSAQGNAADSLQAAKEGILNSQFSAAEAILGNLLVPETRLPPEAVADASLYMAFALLEDRNDSTGAASWEAKALRADPGVDLKRYQDFGTDFLNQVDRLRGSMIASGALPTGVVHLTGLPAGARFVVDNVARTSPDLRLPAGRHTLHVSAPNFHERTDTIFVAAGTEVSRAEALDPVVQPPATVRIGTRPWASVAVDSLAPQDAPLTNVKLRAGAHRLLVARAGYVPLEVQFTVASGTDTTLTFVLRPDSGTRSAFVHPFRDAVGVRAPVLQAALGALDIGSLEDASRLIGQAPAPSPDVAGLRAALAGVIAFVEDNRRGSDSLFEIALRRDPDIRISGEDFNDRVGRAFAAVASKLIRMTPPTLVRNGSVTNHAVFLAGSESIHFLLRVDRPALVTAFILSPASDTVWTQAIYVDSVTMFPWDGRSRSGPPRPLPSGRYTLGFEAIGGVGTLPFTLTVPLSLHATFPDTVADPGPIPDTALLREARGNGARVGLALKGLTFGGLALAVSAGASASWNGPGSGRRAALVAAPALIAGILGAVFTSPTSLDPARVAENARRRQVWEESRREDAQHNATQIAGPYPLTLSIGQ